MRKRDRDPAVFEIQSPADQAVPLVVASPHSGSFYPADLIAAARLDPVSLRRSEDCFVDELFGDCADCGVPLLKALFARAYVDVNREPWELDPGMFEDALPAWVNRDSSRVAAGLGTVARIVSEGVAIYRRKLRFAEAEARVEQFYKPYHAALDRLLNATRQRFGVCLLIDAHSMPSAPGATGHRSTELADIVLGDLNGTSCAPAVIDAAEALLTGLGYRVTRNKPYAGGNTTLIHGQPDEGRHCLQVEINRSLYMNERTMQRKASFATIRDHMRALVQGLGALAPELAAAG
jgi:N-formylglutamate amidohydrolase